MVLNGSALLSIDHETPPPSTLAAGGGSLTSKTLECGFFFVIYVPKKSGTQDEQC